MATKRVKIPDRVALHLWVASGGRCAYPGCNQLLWRDDLTWKQANRAYIAHIVAAAPDGPRGDVTRSPLLAKEFSNLMLLCDGCHRRIDRDEVDEHPESLLVGYKQQHEARIELQTGLAPDRRTQLVMFRGNIAARKGLVTYNAAAQAVLPDRYPADSAGILLDLTAGSVSDDDADFWPRMRAEVERHVATRLSIDVLGTDHLSIFGIAPIPLLILLGRLVGDLRAADVFQLHRDGTWVWKDDPDADCSFGPAPAPQKGGDVAWVLSVSGFVHDAEVIETIGSDVALYRTAIARPSRTWMATRAQLAAFRARCRATLAVIRAAHGAGTRVHVFPALPNAAAVELGRLLLPKSDPELLLYDHQRDNGGWVSTIVV